MPRKTKRKQSFGDRILRIGHMNLAIAAVFVLAFAGVGTWFVARSEAAGSCVLYKLYEYRPGFYGSQCVKDVQYELSHLSYLGYGNLAIDGIYGPQTEAAVSRFGYDNGINNSGQVGSRTWAILCAAGWEFPSVSSNEGCGYWPAYSYGNL